MRTTTPPTTSAPTWRDYWDGVGNEAWQAARRLCEISPRVRSEAAAFLSWKRYEVWDDAGDVVGHTYDSELDWDGFAAHVAGDGTMSSTEHRLALLVASLTTGHPVDLRLLDNLGSWEDAVFRVLLDWVKRR